MRGGIDVQQPLDLVARQLAEDVGRVVGFERRDDRLQARFGHAVEELLERRLADEAQHRCRVRHLELAEEADAELVVVERVEELGGVRGMQAADRLLELILASGLEERGDVLACLRRRCGGHG